MIVTPFQLNRRAQFYQQLGQMTDSGLSVHVALEHLRKGALSSSFRTALTQIQAALDQGQTFSTALLSAGKWLSPFDIALLGAGEQSGRLPACFLKLASYYEERARTVRQLLLSLAYPMFLLHVAVLVFPVTALQGLVLRGEVLSFFVHKILTLLPLYTLIALIAFLAQGNRGATIRDGVEKVTRLIPFFGAARRSMALSRLCLALEALISAGSNIINAWELSSAVSGSFVLQRAVRRFIPLLELGQTPAEAVAVSGAFPPEFVQQYHSAEISGKLDVTLARLHRDYEQQAGRQSRVAVLLLSGIIFGTVVLAVAWQVLSFWLGYFGQIDQIMP